MTAPERQQLIEEAKKWQAHYQEWSRFERIDAPEPEPLIRRLIAALEESERESAALEEEKRLRVEALRVIEKSVRRGKFKPPTWDYDQDLT